MRGLRCALCGDQVDPENPFKEGGIWVTNPKTFRKAWMHGTCYEDALDVLKEQEASSPEYKNRYDEYMSKYNE